jgi:glycine/D-amino acid oxidase-like deaminating enzyme
MARDRVLAVGAGIVGTTTAFQAALAGYQVTLIDARSSLRSSASSLSLGAIRVSGRMPGTELDAVLRSRRRWEAIASRVPGIGLSTKGSLMLLRDAEQIAAAEIYVRAMGSTLDLEMIDADAVRALEPAVSGSFAGAMHCRDDAWIRPGAAIEAMIHYLETKEAIDVRLGTELVGIEAKGKRLAVRTSQDGIAAEYVIIAPGHGWNSEIFGEDSEALGLEHERYHGMRIEEPGPTPSMVLTDASSLDIYPGFGVFTGSAKGSGTFGFRGTDWIAAPSGDGSTLVGLSRTPIDQETLNDASRDWLAERTSAALGVDANDARWFSAPVFDFDRSGAHDPWVSVNPMPGVTVITGLGQYGNTIAPLAAWTVVDEISRLGAVAERRPGRQVPLESPPERVSDSSQPQDITRISDVNPSEFTRYVTALSHEIRTPLTVVLAVVLELVSQHAASEDAAGSELLDEAYQAVERLTAITYDLLSVVNDDPRPFEVMTESVDLAAEVEQVMSLQTERNHVLELGKSEACADPYLVRQVIRGLLRIADQYHPETVIRTGQDATGAWVEAASPNGTHGGDSPATDDAQVDGFDVRAVVLRTKAMGGSFTVTRPFRLRGRGVSGSNAFRATLPSAPIDSIC